ncbi:hypothetical protein SGPA1_60128 [Streptomyces misionensis JCM 4497]
MPVPPPVTTRTLRWGSQVDVQAIGALGHEELTEQAVASYVAKYATKAAETTGTVDHRIGELSELDKLPLPAHTRRLIEACWDLDDAYPERLLARWAHMLGFRGHFSTKSRRCSTTLGALRQVRADYREDLDDSEGSTLVLAHWTYAGRPSGGDLAARRPLGDRRDRGGLPKADPARDPDWRRGDGRHLRHARTAVVDTQNVSHAVRHACENR